MKYFLAKTDPETYSIEDFQLEGVTTWDGVHNYQAINIIKTWNIGDLVFIYHSMRSADIRGIAQVISSPKENLADARFSFIADLKLLKVFKEEEFITLKQIKKSELFKDFSLVKQSRLSVMECPDNFVNWIKDIHPGLLDIKQKK
jgi:predicted RNA-binding protein with PUA-like domain